MVASTIPARLVGDQGLTLGQHKTLAAFRENGGEVFLFEIFTKS